MKTGSLAGFGEGDYGGDLILAGSRLGEQIGVKPGDSLTLISPNGADTAFGSAPNRKAYTVGGLFTVGMSEYDQSFIYMPLAQAQLFFGRGDTVDTIEVNIDTPTISSACARHRAGRRARRDRHRLARPNKSYFNALEVERAVMRLILMLIVAIAVMNIISGLVMLVKNKGRDIAILRTMGASQGAILRVFFLCGALIGTSATVVGLVLGSLFCIFIDPIQSWWRR